jgi:hypothetical protein
MFFVLNIVLILSSFYRQIWYMRATRVGAPLYKKTPALLKDISLTWKTTAEIKHSSLFRSTISDEV